MNMTQKGPEPVTFLDPYIRNEAETIAWTGGVETKPSSEGGMAVTNIEDGDFIKVANVNFGLVGAATFSASVASNTQARARKSGVIELRLDNKDGPLIGALPVPYTAGCWKKVTTSVNGATGSHDLFFVFKGEPLNGIFDFDYWQFGIKNDSSDIDSIQSSVAAYKIDKAVGANQSRLKVIAIAKNGSEKDVRMRRK